MMSTSPLRPAQDIRHQNFAAMTNDQCGGNSFARICCSCMLRLMHAYAVYAKRERLSAPGRLGALPCRMKEPALVHYVLRRERDALVVRPIHACTRSGTPSWLAPLHFSTMPAGRPSPFWLRAPDGPAAPSRSALRHQGAPSSRHTRPRCPARAGARPGTRQSGRRT